MNYLLCFTERSFNTVFPKVGHRGHANHTKFDAIVLTKRVFEQHWLDKNLKVTQKY